MVDFKVSGEASIDPDQIISDVDAILDKLDEFEVKIDEIDEKLDELSGRSIDISLNIDGLDRLDDLVLRLEDLEAAEHSVTMRVDVTDQDRLDKLYLEILELELTDHTVKIDVQTNGIDTTAAKLEAFNKTMGDTSTRADAAGKSTQGFEFSLMMLAPLLIPLSTVLLTAVGGVGGLASAFGTMLPPLALAAYGVDKLYQNINTLYTGLNANTQAALMNATTYGQMYAILDRGSSSFHNMSSLMQEAIVNFVTLKQVVGQFESDIQDNALLVLINGFKLLTTVISLLIDPANEAAGALSNILADFTDRLSDPTFQKFFDDMDKNIGTLVTDWGTGVLNIIEGLVAILDAFMPLGVDMSNGFLNMTQSFDTWAQHLADSQGFKKFVADVEKDGPIVLGILGSLARIIANVVGALGEQSGSSGFLSFLDRMLKDLSQFTSTHQGITGAAGDLLLLGAAASKLGPALGPLMEFIATPFGAAIAAIIALGAGFVYAYTKSESFRSWVQQNLGPTFHQLVGDLQQFQHWAVSIWPEIQKVWSEYGKNIEQTVSNQFGYIVTVIGGALQIIEGIVDFFLGILTGHWGLAWDGVKKIFSGAIQIINGMFENLYKDATQVLDMLWTFMKTNAQEAWNKVVQIFSSTTARIITDVETFFGNIIGAAASWGIQFLNAISTRIATIGVWFSQLPGNVVRWLGNMGSVLVRAGEDLIGGFINGIENMLGKLEGVLGDITSMIPDLKGPPAKDRVLLYDSGQMIMDGLVNGLESRYSKVQNSLGSFTKTIGNTFGSQFTKDISTKIDATLNASSNISSAAAGGRPGAGGGATQVTFASGSIQVNNPTPEQAGTTLTRVLQGVSAWGTIQTPTGFTTG